MRGIIAVFFLTLYAFSMMRPMTPVMLYSVDQKYFAEVLCENKDKPELNCNGHCALTKAVKDFNEPDQKQSTPPPRFNDTPAIAYKSIDFVSAEFQRQFERIPYRVDFIADPPPPKIFHPPRMG